MHIHTQTQKKKLPWRCATGCLFKKRPILRRSSSPPQWKYQHKTLKARPKTTQRLTSAERQKEMWHFLFCRLAEYIRCQAWVLCSYEERYHYRAPFAYWSGSVPVAVQYGAQRICEFKNEKDLCALIETFVLLQTSVIVWVSVGSCSFIHIITFGFVVSSFKEGPPGQDKLSPHSHQNRQKARTLMTVFSRSVLIFFFWCWRWR